MIIQPFEIRSRLNTPLTDLELENMIIAAQAEIVRVHGAAYVDADTPITELHLGSYEALYLKRRIATVDEVREYAFPGSTVKVLEAGDYFVDLDHGMLTHRYGKWGWRVEVDYVPQDDRTEWREAIIDLVRMALSRSALKAESVAGEFSYQAPDWEGEKARIINRLGFARL